MITIFLLLSSVITLIGCNNGCKHLNDASLIVVDEKIEPTCESNGLSEGSHCSLCGEIIEYQETIPSLGHTYKKIEKETVKNNYNLDDAITLGKSKIYNQFYENKE